MTTAHPLLALGGSPPSPARPLTFTPSPLPSPRYHYYSQAIEVADGWYRVGVASPCYNTTARPYPHAQLEPQSYPRYRVEATSPCDVAKAVGVPLKCATSSPASIVFSPNVTRADLKRSTARRGA